MFILMNSNFEILVTNTNIYSYPKRKIGFIFSVISLENMFSDAETYSYRISQLRNNCNLY